MNKSFYFQHDYNSANDVKILYLRQQLGIEGYGIFWFIIEQLAQAGGRLPLKVVPVLAMQIQTSADKVASVINNYELFEIENHEFFSVRLLEQIGFRTQLSEYGKKGGLKSGLIRAKNKQIEAPLEAPLEAETKQRKGKERKGKDIDSEIEFFESKVEAFETWKTNSLLIEEVKMLMCRIGLRSATETNVINVMKNFLLVEYRPTKTKADLESHLRRWVNKLGPKISEHANS